MNTVLFRFDTIAVVTKISTTATKGQATPAQIAGKLDARHPSNQRHDRQHGDCRLVREHPQHRRDRGEPPARVVGSVPRSEDEERGREEECSSQQLRQAGDPHDGLDVPGGDEEDGRCERSNGAPRGQLHRDREKQQAVDRVDRQIQQVIARRGVTADAHGAGEPETYNGAIEVTGKGEQVPWRLVTRGGEPLEVFGSKEPAGDPRRQVERDSRTDGACRPDPVHPYGFWAPSRSAMTWFCVRKINVPSEIAGVASTLSPMSFSAMSSNVGPALTT